jgi:uncharacterized protein YbaP (TraB family)
MQISINRTLRLLPSLLLLLAMPCMTAPARADGDSCSAYTQPSGDAHDAAEQRDIPYGSGLLWRIESGNGPPSHIFGTMHSQDFLATRLPPQVRLALAQSTRLAMEVVPDDEANRIFFESIYFTDDRRLPDLLPADLYARLLRLTPDYGIDPGKIERLQPWAAFTLIGRPRPTGSPTLDMVLYQTALMMGKPVTGLESMEELIAALASLQLSDQLTILADTICNHVSILRDAQQLLQMYLQGDLAGIVRLNEQPHADEGVFQRFMQEILYDRNTLMLERMRGLLAEGGVFIAVGALHLPGERGLLIALEREGYKLTQVY